MRRLLLILTLLFAAGSSTALAQVKPLLTPDVREALVALRAEAKFKPDPEAGYPGASTPEDLAPLNAGVNRLIDQVLARADGPVSENDTFVLVSLAMEDFKTFARTDRERAYAYLNQVWTILGLEGAAIPMDS